MTRDIHRAPSRLASYRPELSWKTHSTRPSEQPATNARRIPLQDPADYGLEQDFTEGVPGVSRVHDSFDGEYEAARYSAAPDANVLYEEPALDSRPIYEIEDEQPYRPIPAVRAPAENGRDNGRAGSRRIAAPAPVPEPAIEPDYAPPPVHHPSPPREALEPPPETYDFTQDRGELSPADQYQLLLYNIQLYDDKWKLLHIRGAKGDRWMRAYLIPRHSKMDWEAARNSGQLLQIAIDNFGNTAVREPKKPGLLRRILNWLYGR